MAIRNTPLTKAAGKVRCAQAVVKQVEAQYAPDMKLGEQ